MRVCNAMGSTPCDDRPSTPCVGLRTTRVGEPDAGNLHVRFDEGERLSPRSLLDRARRFKRAPRPLLPPRAPEPAWSAERAEAARDDFKRRDRRGSSRKFLGVLCALGVSNGLRALCFPRALQSRHRARWGPRPPETISNAEIAERFPENFSAFSARSAFQIGPRPLLPPRAPEPAPGVVGPYDRLRAPPLQHARNARVGESRQSARQLLVSF